MAANIVKKNSSAVVVLIGRILVFVAVISGIACRHPAQNSSVAGVPQRIISLAPSITETLFALGLSDKVVGVTKYCTWPPQASGKTVVGGYSDANLEKILSLHPDLVVTLPEHEKQRRYLEQFSIPVLTVYNATCADVCTTFAVIGRRCAAVTAADSLIGLFGAALVKNAADDTALRPSVLFCVGRDNPGSGTITTAFVAGARTFYDDLITAAGGRNAFHDDRQQFLRISLEGVLAAAPDIVIEMAPAMENAPCSLMVRDWQSLDRIPAVRNDHIVCMARPYATVPGPRLLLLLDDLKQVISDVGKGGAR